MDRSASPALMQYQGGKSRIARDIAAIITGGTDAVSRREIPDSRGDCAEHPQSGGGTFVSLFCGGCAVEERVTGFSRMILNDEHPYLIALYRGVQAGYDLPRNLTKEEYRHIRENKEEDPVLTGFAGFGCSFGGKWFGGYARNDKANNYALETKNSLARAMKNLGRADFLCGDYRLVAIPPRSVIYADPPYKGTTGYNRRQFNTDYFWDYMRVLGRNGHTLYISEMEAPEDFRCVWSKEFRRTLNKNQPMIVTEKLFTYGG